MVEKYPENLAAMKKPSGSPGSARIKTKDSAESPCVAAVITGRISAGAVRKAARYGAGLLELRVDTFIGSGPAELEAAFKKLKENMPLPILLTIRSAREGGEGTLSERQRADLYETLIPYSDMVDIELSSRIREVVVDSARRSKKRVIISHHDFVSTPGNKRLNGIIRSARAAGADIVKIATMVNARDDLKRLAGILCSQKGLIVIGMGPLGRPSRVFFPMLGSLVAYCPATTVTAPGQLSLSQMRAELRRYGF